ncbi:MAG: molybdopterin-synthase adenylyltransferase MoeB [Pseudomonadales bacterium]|nr:molybdopterin-synthase adenylyltransferase MoeB [Pseudomonadales bacterium]
MNDNDLLRYSRQIMLPQLDLVGQERLLAARVLVVGLGGLGCPLAMYLAAAGVGHLTLADADKVDLSNLQRQIAHFTPAIGSSKVSSIRQTLGLLNPGINVRGLEERLQGTRLEEEVANHDVVVDASDNFSTRFAINRACVRQRVPLVSGAAIRMEGQLSVFDSRVAHSPCYACLHPEGQDIDLSCSENGVLAPLVGIIGSMQAVETIKLIAGLGRTLCGRLLLVDVQTMEIRELRLARDPQCPVCRDSVG